jgi:hypothetical protein
MLAGLSQIEYCMNVCHVTEELETSNGTLLLERHLRNIICPSFPKDYRYECVPKTLRVGTDNSLSG